MKFSKTIYLLLFILSTIFLKLGKNFSHELAAHSRKKAIIVGATSGMGRQAAKRIAKDYDIGLVGRRVELLESLKNEITNQPDFNSKVYLKQIDIAQTNLARKQLAELIQEMGGVDLILISVSAWCDVDLGKGFEANSKLLEVDAMGFYAMSDIAIQLFMTQKSGHLVGISSIDALRGNASCPVYSGAKAFVSTYLEGVRNYMAQNGFNDIFVTDILPGWVSNERIDFTKVKGTYWVSNTQNAAEQIYQAIKNKKKVAYITSRWILVAGLLKIMPDWLYNAIGGL
jgi:short-subunit dehydrogenase